MIVRKTNIEGIFISTTQQWYVSSVILDQGVSYKPRKILAQLSHIVLVPYFDEVDKGRVLANFYLGVKEKVGTYFSLDSGTFELRGKPHISLASY